MAFHDPAPAARDCPHLDHGDFTLCEPERERRIEVEQKPKEDKGGLARQLLDAFKLINDLQLQINKLRLDLGDTDDTLFHAVSHLRERMDAANAIIPEQTRPADDDAGEWSNTLLTAKVGDTFTKTADGWRRHDGGWG